MAARALKAALAAPLLLPQGGGGYMLPRQDFFSPANYGGVDSPLGLGGKVAPAVLEAAGSLAAAASATTAGSSISSSSAQPTSADDVGLGSGETCDPEDAECKGDNTDEMTFSVLYWIRTLFVWFSVARTTIVAIMYIAGTATSLFVAIRRMLSPGSRSGAGGGGGGGSASASWSVGRVLGGLIHGRGTPGARTAAGPRALRGAPISPSAPSAVIIVPTVFPAAGATSPVAGSTAATSPLPATTPAIATTAGGGAPATTNTAGGGGSGGTAGGGGGGGRRVPARISRIVSNTDRFVAMAHENMDDALVAYECL